MKKIKPYAGVGYYTPIHNAVLDVVMPSLSPNAWKILSLIIRPTRGWQRDEAGISYKQIAAGTGIKWPGTIKRAHKELIDGQHIVASRGTKWESFSYRLNRGFEVSLPTVKNEVVSTVKNEAHLNRKKEKENKKGIEVFFVDDILEIHLAKICVFNPSDLTARQRADIQEVAQWLHGKYPEKTAESLCAWLDKFAEWFTAKEWKDQRPTPQLVRERWERFRQANGKK